MSLFPNEAPPPYTPGPYQPIQQAPYPGQNQGPYPGPQQGPYLPGSAPYPGQENYGGQQPPPGGVMYPPQQDAYYTGQQGGPPPPPGQYNQDRPKNEDGGHMQNCMETFCCGVAGYCACKIIIDMLCCICGLLGDD